MTHFHFIFIFGDVLKKEELGKRKGALTTMAPSPSSWRGGNLQTAL